MVEIIHGDSLKILPTLKKESFDLIFLDPPYFLSNDGFSFYKNQKISVNKGEWDRGDNSQKIYEFYKNLIKECMQVLKPNGSIWVCGTYHNIYLLGTALLSNKLKILNEIIWQKPKPMPTLHKKRFNFDHETMLWSIKPNAKPVFNKLKNKESIWKISPPKVDEKTFGRHPTQKPIELLEKIILTCTNSGNSVLDPFMGSGTTGVVCKKLNRNFVGIESNKEYFELSKKRMSGLAKVV